MTLLGKLNSYELMLLGQVAHRHRLDRTVKSFRINEKEVSADGKEVLKALDIFERSRHPAEGRIATVIDKTAAWAGDRIQNSAESKYKAVRFIGQLARIADFVQGNPEAVYFEGKTEAIHNDGRVDRNDSERVDDVRATLANERVALASLALTGVPGMLFAITLPFYAGGVVTGLARSIIEVFRGRHRHAIAGFKSTLKIFGYGLLPQIPILGNLFAPLAAAAVVRDSSDVRDLTVAQMNMLRAEPH